ncbi:MAG: riboflavin synthase [Candidatus Cloacimonetes bacterium]|nr:riboflavin synthase [Candidatus Cloacimonadota bacterium]
MFTGIIEEIGKIKSVQKKNNRSYFTITCKIVTEGLKIGDSVACNGICLTAVRVDNSYIEVEAMPETLNKTTASFWTPGQLLNLERAARINGRFDGHIVQGHIDEVLLVSDVQKNSNVCNIYLNIDKQTRHLLVEQGSVAIDGVSLTVAEIKKDIFKVALISHTKVNTTLNELRAGSRVNVEYDIIGKYVANYMKKESFEISENYLIEKGF